MIIPHLSYHSQQYETKIGENDGKNKRKVPVSGLQKEFAVNHNDNGLSEGHLEAPEIRLPPGPGEILDKEGHQRVPQGQGGPPEQAPMAHQGIRAIPKHQL